MFVPRNAIVYLVSTLIASTFSPVKSLPSVHQLSSESPGQDDSGRQQPPWGNARPFQDMPYTGKTRYFKFNITKGSLAPDGVTRQLILINGQYIGPTIEADWGDDIEVTVLNNLSDPAEGTSIHWHGQPQKLSPQMDGVPSVSQCPIPPGSNFTYRFRAESFGTGWYHSHISAQYLDGLFGAMVIHGPKHVDYDIDLGPVILQDYQHIQSQEYLKPILSVPFELPPSQTNLINGKNPFNYSEAEGLPCTTDGVEYSTFEFVPGKSHRLRLINAGGLMDQKFSIDGHQLTVIAQDYVPVQPYQTSVVTVGTGQRTDVLVVAKEAPANAFWIRSDLQDGNLCATPNTTQTHAKAILRYTDTTNSSSSALPTSEAFPWDENYCMNDPLALQVPFYPLKPPATPTIIQLFNLTETFNSTGHVQLPVNNVSFYADYNQAILPLAVSGQRTFPTNWSVYDLDSSSNTNNTNTTTTPTSVRAIFYNYFANPHPMHLHGHDFWILAEGNGTWDGASVVNAENPARRDTHIMAPALTTPNPQAPGGLQVVSPSYLVIEWMLDNPGVWPLHCHFVLHNALGLYVNVLERPRDVSTSQGPGGVVDVARRTCEAWTEWSARNFVDQTDAGV